jgi:predicted DNA-binding protein (UPF0278 family)
MKGIDMRKVLKNHSEVAHFWANQVQAQGKGSNMFYENGTIYSYGYHFPIARHIGNNVILFTTRNYSISTSKHISYTKQAIPGYNNVIYADDIEIRLKSPSRFNKTIHAKNVLSMLNTIKNNLDKSTRARSNKEFYLADASRNINNMVKYIDLFKCKSILPYKTKKLVNEILNGNQYCLLELAEKERKALKQKQALLKKKALKDLKKWRNGEIYDLPFGLNKRYLRLVNNEVETSGHIKISAELFLEYYKRLKSGFDLTGLKISHYRIDKQTEKSLKIGCHSIDIDEIENIARLLIN